MVRDGHRQLRGDGFERAFVVWIERIFVIAIDLTSRHAAPFSKDGNAEFGRGVEVQRKIGILGVRVHVPRVLRSSCTDYSARDAAIGGDQTIFRCVIGAASLRGGRGVGFHPDVAIIMKFALNEIDHFLVEMFGIEQALKFGRELV